jgi:hypothetical protein
MSDGRQQFSVNTHFSGKDQLVRTTYDQLLRSIRRFGPTVEEPKKTSIHSER